jgi:8-oxo-dGTP diphosphatase
MASPRIAAGAVIRNSCGDVLLVKPSYKDGWDVPGGYVEPGESPAQGCTREIAEEIGLHRPAGRLLVVDWAPHPDEGAKILFLFDGGILTDRDLAELHVDGTEIIDARLFPTARIGDLTPERLARRLHLAFTAYDDGTVAYAEHGQQIDPER